MAVVCSLAASGAFSAALAAKDGAEAVKQCREVADDAARLKCFDAAVKGMGAPTYEGRLSLLTEPFELTGPALLRFQSDGAIFVLYLKSEDGTVLQNLHIGGGGEDRYRIETAGIYRLQINGSEGWRVWVEPEKAKTN